MQFPLQYPLHAGMQQDSLTEPPMKCVNISRNPNASGFLPGVDVVECLQDSATAKTLAFNKEVRTRCVTLEGDDFNPSGILTGTPCPLLPTYALMCSSFNIRHLHADLSVTWCMCPVPAWRTCEQLWRCTVKHSDREGLPGGMPSRTLWT